MNDKHNILIAPLNWGLGHATRCIPIIELLLNLKQRVIIASDGDALLLLRSEFPNLEFIELPPYRISYPKNGKLFKWKLILQLPKINTTIIQEHKTLKKLIKKHQIDAVISDNRPGLYSKIIPSIYITHQTKVLSGWTTQITSYLHQYYIKKFSKCWIPDYSNHYSLSGKLSKVNSLNLKPTYIAPLSRLKPKLVTKKYDILAILSGPEPQRTILEEILLIQFKNANKKILLVRGIPNAKPIENKDIKHLTIINFMKAKELELSINQSEIIIARSGYSTIMDLTHLGKKAFFIPTPGQYEQEYLAKRLQQKGIAPFSIQSEFTLNHLTQLKQYKGFGTKKSNTSKLTKALQQLLSLLDSKRKLRANP